MPDVTPEPVDLVYFAPADLQVARVDRQCIVYFCAAATRAGADVTLSAIKIRPRPDEPPAADPLDLYRVQEPIRTRLLRVPVQQESRGAWIALNRLLVHAIETARRLVVRPKRPLVLFTKTYSTALVLLAARALLPRSVVLFEAHLRPRSRLQHLVLRRADGVVANTHALARDLVASDGIEAERVIGTHQGVDLSLWDGLRVDRAAARRELGLPEDGRLVVYTGKVVDGYREIDHILAAAARLAGRTDTRFLIVGGRADHVERLRERVSREGLANVTLTGFIPPRHIHLYQLAADVLLLYYPSGIDLNEYRSPGKLFEYMAAARPIACVDLPVLREVLGDPPAAAMVPQDDPERFAAAIAGLLDDPAAADALARRALDQVAAFTWDERARQIIAFARERAAVRSSGG
jgi:glycosyltransferase involved in cell wall biosynthesis